MRILLLQERKAVADQPLQKKLVKLSQKLAQPGLPPEERARVLAKLDKRLAKAAAQVEVCLVTLQIAGP